MPSTPGLCQLSGTRTLDSPPPASSPQGPGDGARRCGESGGGGGRVPLGSGGCVLQVGGLCGVPGRGTQESGEGPGAAWEGESRPESSTFSGDEDEKGEGLEVNPRLLEPRGANRQSASGHAHTESPPILFQATPTRREGGFPFLVVHLPNVLSSVTHPLLPHSSKDLHPLWSHPIESVHQL